MENLKKAFDNFADAHRAHVSHLPELQKCTDRLGVLARRLRCADTPHISYMITRVQCLYLLGALKEMNEGLLESLESRRYSNAEALSRIAIEHAVNLMYVCGEAEHSRSKAFLKHYVDGLRSRAIKWGKSAQRNGLNEGVRAAGKKLKFIEQLANENKHWLGKNTSRWPNAYERFSEVGVEYLYHVLFASASDSVHSLSEDIFNATLIEGYPEEAKLGAWAAFKAEKASFAVYLTINAVSFYAEAVGRLAVRLDDQDVSSGVDEVGRKLKLLLAEHEKVSAQYR